MNPRLGAVSRALAAAGLDGWLFYDFRLSDPIAYRVLGLSERGTTTRRWFCYVPAHGAARALVSAVEARRLDSLGVERIVYQSSAEMLTGLGTILGGARRVAMNYSPRCAIPYVSRVDAGTVELVRSLGVEVVSAADLIQEFEATLSAAQLDGHRRAGAALGAVVDQTFAEIARRVAIGEPATEYAIQQFMMERIERAGLVTREPPIVAANAHSADPHFGTAAENPAPIGPGDFVLLDLWAKEPGEDSVYADITWTGFVGETVPVHHAEIFAIVRAARDAAVELVKSRVAAALPISGREADRAARGVIEHAGFAAEFVHRTGHSIGREVHGMGANLDSLETDDDRRLIDRTCFSVEPGIYLSGRFGVRSELDMTVESGRAQVSPPTPQPMIVPIMGRGARTV
ncbi:MAG TPA: M24 family metallopeptidase [Candidatus Binataceae bacterium]|nr:M24 family metallopeptidase [Candidatus Binataceae bacterium]